MSRVQRILDHYDGVLNGAPWHGADPIYQILDGISAERGNCTSLLADHHTIWEIVMHMTFWERAWWPSVLPACAPDWWTN